MALEWYEWECPYCRRIGQVNPAKDYENGEVLHMNCPTCNLDTEPVIRCKDCRYVWIRGDRLFCERDGGFVEVTPTDFCSRGEVEQ